jgi:hypothetical protein
MFTLRTGSALFAKSAGHVFPQISQIAQIKNINWKLYFETNP